MTPQPILGLFFHALGGVAAASFYAPLKFIRAWPWECFYLAMGVFAWAITPWVFAFATTPDLVGILSRAPASTLGWTFLFGLLWGIGAVTFGLSMRYLGMALGMSVALGFCAVFGTLVPPIYKGELVAIAGTGGGQAVLSGVTLCVIGILVAGYAGIRKEKEIPAEVSSGKHGSTEFSPGLGVFVAFICGLMSACFAFGIQSGLPIAALAVEAGANPLFQNNPTLCIILLGGFITNTLWCLFLNRRNCTFKAYRSTGAGQSLAILGLCLLAGVIWYFQFFFYGMGSTKMGAYEFSSWSLHMAAIIIFGNLWGIFFKEWRGVSRGTLVTVWLGITILILSTAVIGWGNSLSGTAVAH